MRTPDGIFRSRRTVLRAAGTGGAAAFALAGCGLFGEEPAPPPPPDPLQRLLDTARAMVGRYDAALAAGLTPAATLTAVRDNHVKHAEALAVLIGAGTGTPSPSAGATPTLATLRAAEQAAQREAAAACLATPAARAELVGSICAGRASHVEVLR